MKSKLTIVMLLLLTLTVLTAQARVPRKNPSAFDKGTLAYNNRQYQQAIEFMDQALANNSDNGFALAYKGSAQRMLDRPAEAVTSLKRATTLINDANTAFRAWAHSECFNAYLELGDTATALVEIGKAISDNDREVSYVENRAIVYSRLGNFDAALADYDRALILDPSNQELIESRQRVVEAIEYSAHVNEGYEFAERDITEDDQVVLPEFPGGRDALHAYVNQKTGWVQGPSHRVLVEVAIDEHGNITESKIHTGVNDKLDKKALDICRRLPCFAPATYKGKPIKCNYVIPVRFKKK